MPRLTAAISTLALASALFCNPAHAAPRAFVASNGNDANTATSCAPTTPCRAFSAAHSVVDAGGEIIALDAAGYGAVTITKSVSIIGNPGFFAGIAASSGDAITIATGGVNVTLRNLNLNGLGTAPYGVNMTNGSTLTIENCVIYGFSFMGVDVSTAATVRMKETTLRNNGSYGIRVDSGATLDVSRSAAMGHGIVGFYVRAGTVAGVITTASFSDSIATGNAFAGWAIYTVDATATARATITRSSATENGSGIWNNANAGTLAYVTVSNTMASFNSTGFANFVGTFYSQGNNTVHQNGTNTSGVITGIPGT